MLEDKKPVDRRTIREEFAKLAPTIAKEAPTVFEAAVDFACDGDMRWKIMGQAHELIDMERLLKEARRR